MDGVVLGQGVNGTLYGSPVLTSDSREGMAMYFNGNFQGMSVPNPTGVCIGNPEYCPEGHTMTFWFKRQPKEGCSQVYIFNGGSGHSSHQGIMGKLLGDKFIFRERTQNSSWNVRVEEHNIPINKWCHLAVTWHSGIGLAVYINGDLFDIEDTGEVQDPPNNSFKDKLHFSQMKDGDTSACRYGNFTLDNVMIWAKHQSQEFIKLIYYNFL